MNKVQKYPDAVWHARMFAVKAHGHQKYGTNRPYVVHLDEVDSILITYGYGSIENRQAAYLHDVLEDVQSLGVTDMREAGFSERVVYIAEFCEDDAGPNRRTRKQNTYMRMRYEMSKHRGDDAHVIWDAIRVKLADRLGNLRASIRDNSSLLGMYIKEREAFRDALYQPGTADRMWDEYDALTGIELTAAPNRKK